MTNASTKDRELIPTQDDVKSGEVADDIAANIRTVRQREFLRVSKPTKLLRADGEIGAPTTVGRTE